MDFWMLRKKTLFSQETVECKFKRLQNPVSIPSLVNFADDENIKLRYIVNINLDTEYKGVHLTPGILVDRIGK